MNPETESWVRLRWTKPTRYYYEVHLAPDLWGQWMVTRIWGRTGTALGRRMSIPCASYQEGLQQIATVKARRRQRGYQMVGKVVSADARH